MLRRGFSQTVFCLLGYGPGWSNERFNDLFQNTLPFISRRQFDEFSRNAIRLSELVYSDPSAGIRVRSPILVERLLDSNSILSYYGYERFDDLLFGDAIPDSLRMDDRYKSEVQSLELYMRSSDSAFVKAIEENIERDNDVSFFLATDCQETQFMLQSRFGKRIITTTRKWRYYPRKPSCGAFESCTLHHRADLKFAFLRHNFQS